MTDHSCFGCCACAYWAQVVLTAGLAFDVLGWDRFLAVYMVVNGACTMLSITYSVLCFLRQRKEPPGLAYNGVASTADDAIGLSTSCAEARPTDVMMAVESP